MSQRPYGPASGGSKDPGDLHILPMPINSQTSYWSRPILSAITLSCNIHTGRIGAISDQFALGTPWDEVRRTASQLAIQFRHAHGVKQPATLHEDELEYQEGNGSSHGTPPASVTPSASGHGRPEEID